MEIINNRYRLKELLSQEKHVTVYLAFDMRNDNKVVLLNLLNSEYLPKTLIDFYVNRFIEIKGLTSNNIIQNYNFNTVSFIDNKLQSDPQYFYTSEYITARKNLFNITKKLTFKEIIDYFVEICTAVHYLHLKGFVHGALNRNAVFVNTGNEELPILLEDVATVQMERMTNAEQIGDSAYKSPKVLAGRIEDVESDIYSLGVILLAILTNRPSLNNPKEELSTIKKNSVDLNVLKIVPILSKMLETENEQTYSNLYDLIMDLNAALEENYTIVKMEEFEGLNLHTKLVGRDEHIQKIIKANDKMISYQPGKRIFFVQGANGIGKTRLLQEVNFLLDLSKASVYASYSLNSISDDSKKMWIDILRELIMETNQHTVEKYNIELMEYFPELVDKNYATSLNYSNEHNTKYRLLNRIAGFISESIQNRPTAFIIDNIHLADDFTIDTFNYLCTEVLENTNLTVIFSCEDSDVSHNPVASDFIKNMKKRIDSETIRLEQLDEKQTGEMIQSILSISFTPRNISRRIYSQSYGNPLFITEIMKDLYSRQIIYVGEDTGKWQIDLPDDKDYNKLDLPDSVEHALVNQLKDLYPSSMEILMTISLFPKPISMRMMENFLTSDKLESSLEDLVKKGVLQRLIGDNSYLYDFRSKVLKNIVYDKIQPDKRLENHKLAASIIEEHMDVSYAMNLDELIFQFVRSNNHEKAKTYYLENAKKMQAARNTKAQIENLKQALEHTELLTERTGLYLEIGALLSDAGDFTSALEYLEKAERLAIEDNHTQHKISTYVNLANAFVLLRFNERVLDYIAKAEKEMEHRPDKEARLDIKRIRASLILEENQLSEAADLFIEVIEECGERFKKIKGNAYRTLGFIYLHIGKTEMALESYHKSVNLLEEIDDARGALLSLNNIGHVYAEIYEDQDKAMEYHLKVKNLSEEYGIFTSEVYSLINIAESHLKKYDFDTAYDHFSLALTKAERYNMSMEKYVLLNFLTRVTLEMNNYPEALELYRQLKTDIKDNPNKGFDIGDYYQTSAMLHQLLGNYDQADNYNQKTIQFHSEHENILKYTATVNVLINQLQHIHSEEEFLTNQIIQISEKITNKNTNIDSLCQAIHHLCAKNKYKLAYQIFSRVEQYIQEDTPERLKSIYLHAKGAIEFHVNPNQSIGYLEESLELAKNTRSKELISRIQADLGNAYYAMDKYYEAANYYLESSEGIKVLISQIPDAYKLNYINGRKFSKEFYRLAEIKGWMTSHEWNQDCLPQRVSSNDDLKALLQANNVDSFINNQEFMQYVSNQYMEKLSGGIFHKGEIFLQHLDSDVMKNLDSIGKFLSGKLLATKGYILAEEKGQELTVLSSINGNHKIPGNASIYNRVRSTMKPVLLSKWTNEEMGNYSLLLDDLKGVMCIPIIKRLESKVSFGENNQVLGYIYLETDKIVNNFNQRGLEKCMEMVNFLVLLLEKRQLMITASIDKLTGTLTRKYLEDALQNTLDFSRKSGNEFSIIMFDLDKFKGVNDRYGHQIGDRVLREVSQVIINNLDQTSMVGRYGGEEFVIILPSVKLDDAKRIAETLRKKVQDQRLLGEKHEVTISMGLASYPVQGQTVRELILKADQALYIAKENGRNNSQIWHKDFENKVKPANKLIGIISGDEIRDARNVLALVELVKLTNLDIALEDKLYQFLGRMIEIVEAQFGYILISDGHSVINWFGRKSQEEEWIEQNTYNEEIVSTVITDRLGLYTIDWQETEKINNVNGLPDWDSIISVPIISNGWVKGVIYLSVPARIKEFGADELNVLNVYSELMANII